MAEEDKKSIPDIKLNNIENNTVYTESFDAQRANIGHLLKKVQKEAYTPDITKGVTFYKGIILRKEEEKTFGSGNSWFGTALKRILDPNSQIRSYKIRVPEIHKQIPLPEVYGILPAEDATTEELERYAQSSLIIDQYPTFVEFYPDSPENENLKEGDIVWCIFGNTVTFEEPYLYSKVFSEAKNSSPTTKKTVTPAKTPNSPPPDVPPGLKPKPPPKYNGKYLVEYSRVIDVLAGSKGWPYRFGTYTLNENPNGNNPFTAFEQGANGVDCIGLVRKCLIKLEIFDYTDREKLIELANIGATKIADVFDLVPKGQQLPGDVCRMVNKENSAHVMFVATYPDDDGDSYMWGANFGAGQTNGDTINAFCGSNRGAGYYKRERAISFGLIRPKSLLGIKWDYYRVPKKYRHPTIAKLAEWPIKSETPPSEQLNQYQPPDDVRALPNAVISSTSLFNYNNLNHRNVKIRHEIPEK